MLPTVENKIWRMIIDNGKAMDDLLKSYPEHKEIIFDFYQSYARKIDKILTIRKAAIVEIEKVKYENRFRCPLCWKLLLRKEIEGHVEKDHPTKEPINLKSSTKAIWSYYYGEFFKKFGRKGSISNPFEGLTQ